MKNPAQLLRIALVLGTLMGMAAPGLAQEIGSAEKGAPVTVSDLADKQSSGPRSFRPGHKRLQKEPQALPVTDAPALRRALAVAQPLEAPAPDTLAEPSPNPSLSFVALPDSGEVVPPDTSGAVGTTHLVVACASEIRISDRLGGAISTRSQEDFWAGVGANIFDTRVVFDPYGQRFIMTAAADPGGANPRLCIAVSATSNPTGTWYRWSEDMDVTNPVYADSPNLGFNKTWIVVQANMFNKTTFAFFRSEVFAYNKANLYANGAGQRTRLVFDPSLGGSQVPATMYDSTNALVHFVKDWNGLFTNDLGQTEGYLRLFYLSGGIGSERLNVTNTLGEPIWAFVGATWAQSPSNDLDILPQLNNTNKIYAGDSRIQNVHFRDGLLYAAQTAFLPAINATRAAVQWWSFTASGEVKHFGRVQDFGGTNMFAYPSIAANQYQDVLLGYSRFSPLEYPSAAYSFRRILDADDELRGEVILKPGEASYDEPVFGQNRWGDWSATTVDPVNDVDLWTIQEYAAPRSGTGGSRWGTWWGRVSPPSDLAITMTDSPDPVPAGGQITYTLLVTNRMEEVVSGVRVQDTLPAGVSFVSASSTKGSCGHTNGVVSCLVGPMTEFDRVTITLTVTAGLPALVTNTALVFANGPEANPADNSATNTTEIVSSADLQVQGTDNPDPVHVGNTLAYSLTISNRGPSAAGGVVLTSTLPASVSIGAVNASQGFWTTNGNVLTFTLGVINNGATANLSISVTPNAGDNITHQVRVAANTADIAPANNTLAIATLVNARPVINFVGTQTINEDVATVIPITISDAETPAASLLLSATSSNQGLIPNANIQPGGSGGARNLTITSAPNQFGSNTTITVTVTDSHGASTSLGFMCNVAAVNDPPTITDIPNPAAINEDGATSPLGFTLGDIDSPISALTLSGNSSSLTLVPISNINFTPPSGASRFVTVTPAANRSGTATITVTVSDGALPASDTFVVTVNPVNDPPVISGIGNQFTDEDTPTAAIPFTVSDVETLATNLTVTTTSSNTGLVPDANIARVNLGTNRSIQLTPALNQNGVTTITVRVSDGTNSQTTTFDLTVRPVNDPPTLTQPSNVTTSEDAGTLTVNLSGIGPGASNEPQTLNVSATTGTSALLENVQVQYTHPNATGTVTFNPVPHAFGTGVVNVVVSDGVPADNLTRQFQVIIGPINDPPTIDPIANISVPEDSPQRTITLTGISTGPPNESDQTLTFMAVSSAPAIVPDPQIAHVNGAVTASLNFTPALNATGTVTITVTVNDGRPLNPTTVRTFQITVDPVNDLPTISAIADRRINEDSNTGAIGFTFRDVEPGPLTLAGFSSNQGLVPDGNVVIVGTNVTVTPRPNEFGTATITVRVTDSEGGATNETFVLTVDPVNDPPTLAAIPGPLFIEEDATTQTVGLAGITQGPANETGQTVIVTATSSNPSIVPHPNVAYSFPNLTGALTYTPAANATGSVVITVTANDQQGSNNLTPRTLTVQINPVNDLPTITGDFDDKFTDEDVAVSFTFTIGDVETPVGSLTLNGSSSNPEVVADGGITFTGSGATRTVTVRPLTNEVGSAFIFIDVTDTGGGTTQTGFLLNVQEVDDPPLISIFSLRNISEDTAMATTNFWINDVDSPLANLEVTATSSNPGLVPDANIVLGGSGTNRTIRLTPVSDGNGVAIITLRVSDGHSNRTSQFQLTVNEINDQPTLVDIPNQPLLEDAAQQLLTLTVGPGAANETSDVLTVTAISSVPALIPHPVGTNDNGVWKLRFTPAANANGSANITVTVNDGRPINPTISKSFTVTVQAVNDPPTLNAIANLTLNEDWPATNITITGISAGGGESQTLTFSTSSSNPTLVPAPVVTYSSGTSGTLRLIPAGNSTGAALITVRLSDGGVETVQTFTVTLNAVNEPPTITGIGTLITPEDTPISAQFTIADEETFAARLTLSATSTNTTLVPNANITFHGSDSNRWVTITPATNLFGLTRVTITASDGTNNVSTSFNVTVNSVNDAPTLNILTNVALTTDPSTFTVNLSGIGSGAANESQTLSVRVTSSTTSLVPTPSVSYTSPNTTGSISVNPANSGTGSSVITVTVWDNGSPSNSFSRSFTVYIRASSNSRPTLSPLTNQTTLEDTPITVPFTVGDSATAASNLVVGALSSNLGLVPTNGFAFGGTTNNRSVTITPLPNQSGTATITLWVIDSASGYTSSNFVLTVTAVNDRPTITAIASQTIDRGTNMPPVPFTIEDAETPAPNLTLAATSSNQALLPNANVILGGSGTNRSVMAYPVPGQTGSATITITVTDANSASTNTTFVLTVRAPQPPLLGIRRSGPGIDLFWSTEAGLFTVQGRDHLHTGTWTDIIATPGVSGTNYVVPQAATGPHKFFRLRN